MKGIVASLAIGGTGLAAILAGSSFNQDDAQAAEINYYSNTLYVSASQENNDVSCYPSYLTFVDSDLYAIPGKALGARKKAEDLLEL